MRDLEDRIVAHHVGGRGFGVALNVPARFSRDVVNVLYEADENCALEMIAQNTSENFHVLPHCLGREDKAGKLYITNNPYASSNLKPNPEYDSYYCEVMLSGEIDGVSVQDTRYDAVYGNENRVVEVRDVTIHALDTLVRDRKVPGNLKPDFLSLDTQGSELDILCGAQVTFRDHCIALATEIEFHPMYEGQALFSGIFDFALRHGFYFAGFTYLQEISPKRMPVGARGKGFLAFGDALFLRRIDSVKSIAGSQNEQHLMLLKLAFVALNFGYLEYALLVLEVAEQAPPDPELRARLLARDCYRLLYELIDAAKELPPSLLHTQRSELVAERRTLLGKGQPIAPVATSPAKQASHEATDQTDRLLRRIATTPVGSLLDRLARALWRRAHGSWRLLVGSEPPARQPAQPTPVVPEAMNSAAAEVPPVASPALANPPSIEHLLDGYGYGWLANEVRQRRQSAERYVASRVH
jgi:FkbM family methyltransferase